MRRSLLFHLLAKSAVAIQILSNFTTSGLHSSEPSCIGTSTYSFTPLETVFVTVDGSYTYIGSNDTKPTNILYTPPPPCSSVIIPTTTQSPIVRVTTITMNTTSSTTDSISYSVTTIKTSSSTTICKQGSSSISTVTKSGTSGPFLNTTSTTARSSTTDDCTISWIEFATTLTEPATSTTKQGGHPHPNVPTDVDSSGPPNQTPPPPPSPEVIISSITENGALATPITQVTVTVTKKTPVLQTPATNGGGAATNGPTFPQNNQPITVKSTSPKPNQPGNTAGGNTPVIGQTNAPGNDGNSNIQPTGAGTSPGQTVGAGMPTGNGNSGNNNNNNIPVSTANAPPPTTITGSSGLGAIINSVFNSPFTAVIGVSTSLGAASAAATLLGGVPVQVESSSVYIGGSYVALPTGTSTALVTIAGQTFTVNPTAVVVGTSTLGLGRPESISYTAVQAATEAASTITRSGVIITVQPTAAVISGTTYMIGLNAPSTTAIVNGQTLTFNGDGVVFGSSTYAPAMITAPAYVVTTIGSLTISIDKSQAIISGTTYSIGAGSSGSKTTAVVDGTTITFGPSGIILPSTTIAPTSVQLTGTGLSKTSASAATRVVSDASISPTSNAGAPSQSPSFLSSAFCVTIMALAFATFPLSLIL